MKSQEKSHEMIYRRDVERGLVEFEDPDMQSLQVIDGDTIRLDGLTIRLNRDFPYGNLPAR